MFLVGTDFKKFSMLRPWDRLPRLTQDKGVCRSHSELADVRNENVANQTLSEARKPNINRYATCLPDFEVFNELAGWYIGQDDG